MAKSETKETKIPLSEQAVERRSGPARRKKVFSEPDQKVWLILLLALAMTVLEGAFRKWVFPQGGMVKYLLYFSKDIIFATLLIFPQQSQPSPASKVFEKWLLSGCGLLVIGIGLSCLHGINPVGAVLSLRELIILPLIAWLAVPRLAGLQVRWGLWLLAAFTIINCALGFNQNHLPPDHIINRYAEEGMFIVTTSSGTRATGMFAYITGMSIISAVGIWAGLSLMSLAKTHWHRVGAWATVAASFGCGLASISRGPIVVGLAMVAGWLVASRDGVSVFLRSLVAGAFCLIVASGLGLAPIFTGLGTGLLERNMLGMDTFGGRAFGQFGEMLQALKDAPLGHGFGTEQMGGQYYATGEANFNHFESPLPRLVMETGAIGLIGYLMIVAGALLALQQAKREATNARAKSLILATQLYLLVMFYGSELYNHTASAFTWMIFAAVLAAAETNKKAETQKIEILKVEMENGRGAEPLSERAPYSVTGNVEPK